MTTTNREIQAELAQPATWIFNATSSHLFWTNFKASQERKLQADLWALNTCQAQNQANLDVKMALEKESDQQLQTNDLINKMVKKRMKPILANLQSLKAKTAKNFLGGPHAQASQPSARSTSKRKPSKPSTAKSSKQKSSKGDQVNKTKAKQAKLTTLQSKRPATPAKKKPQATRKNQSSKKQGSTNQAGANNSRKKGRK